MRWLFLAVGLGSVAMLYGVGPQLAMPLAFAVLCVNFTTFCLQYDEPLHRARQRVANTLSRMSSGGVHSQEYQRLQSAAPVVSAEDRRTRYGPMTIANIVSGIAAIALLCWAIMLRTM